jgi:WD40 repeat protein
MKKVTFYFLSVSYIAFFLFSCTPLGEQAGKHFVKGTELAKAGKNLAAAQSYAKAAELRKQPEAYHEVGLPNAQYKAAYYYDEAGKTDLAIQYYKESLANWEKTKGHEDSVALCHADLGYVYKKRLKDLKTSLKHYETALKIYEDLKWNKSIGSTLYSISNIYWDQKEYQLSLEVNVEAADYVKKGKDWEKAKKYYNEALKYAKKYKYTDIVKKAKKGLSLLKDAPLIDGIVEKKLPDWANYQKYRQDDPIKVVIQNDHLNGVKVVKFSPDGRYLATASKDKTIKLWNMNGQIVNILPHRRNDDIEFISKFGNTGRDGAIITPGILWSANGKLLQEYGEGQKFVTLSKNESNVLAGEYLYGFNNDHKLGGGHYRVDYWQGINDAFFALDHPRFEKSTGSIIVIGDYKGGIGWTDWERHNLRYVKYHEDEVIQLAYTPDRGTFFSASKDGTVREWDAREGRSKFKYGGFEGPLKAIVMHPGGKIIVAGTDKSIDIWDIGKNGKRLKRIKRDSQDGTLTSLDISPDGKYIAAGSEKGKVIRVWTITGEVVRESGLSPNAIQSIALHPDSQLIATGTNNEIRLWDIKGQLIKNFKAHSKKINSLAFSPDGKYLVSCSNDKTIKLWTDEGILIRTIKGHSDWVNVVAFHPNSKMILSGGDDGQIILWNLDGTVSKKEKYPYFVQNAAFHPSGNRFVFGLATAGIGEERMTYYVNFPKEKNPHEISSLIEKDLNMKTLNEMEVVAKTIFRDILYAPDGKKIITSDSYFRRYFGTPQLNNVGRVLVWDFEKDNLSCKSDKFGGYGSQIVIDPKNPNIVILAGKNGHIKFIDFEDYKRNKEIKASQYQRSQKAGPKIVKSAKAFTGHTGEATSLAITPDGRFLVSGSLDGTIKVWNKKTSYNISMAAEGNEWIVYSNDGYFDSSKNNGQKASITKGLDVFGIDQFAIQRNRPDLYLTKIGLGSPTLINHYAAQYKKRLRKAGIKEEKQNTNLNELPIATVTNTKNRKKTIHIDFTLEEKNTNLKSYNIYVNDVPLFGAYGKPVTGKKAVLKEQIELISGKNKIEISCLNDRGSESYRTLTMADYDNKVQGDLYFIGFGVSKYKNSNLNLKFAHQDAKDIAGALSKMKNNLRQFI